MEPRPITDDDLQVWSEVNPRRAVFTAPGEVEAGVLPCSAIVTDDPDATAAYVIRVPWVPNEIEMAHLVKGGTIWLSCWNGLPVHSMVVEPPR